ncbi:surfactin synthase thioesterase subunit/acyl carrier protein [Streptomyces griseochromogenes]|uniref:Surfactin synthase thioesterase subunit/acyl carrier protein n=1 Tax=Streptomyces griseochromogenes TaxID=68214 RepID=A0ABS4LLS0_9ACTN|nr:alpha/beta fold hydrolase [Streptomyces griseochromogenes]MBP2048339.1 surfactin synthase thioesterase subunit/acyl carrier protein [Streptomyces griseochromogenes]
MRGEETRDVVREFPEKLDKRNRSEQGWRMQDNDFGTPTERRLADIWADILRLDNVKRDQDFFDAGGDSLLATKVVLRVCREWDIKFTVRVLNDAPVLADLAERIDQRVTKSGQPSAGAPSPAARASRAGACLWEMRPGTAGAGQDTLLLLPHAGGSAQNYASWADFFPKDLRILAAQYPGRAARADEPAAADLHHIVDEILDALGDVEGRLYVFGHSMGSYVGYELCWRQQLASRPPVALFASGAVPPHRHRPNPATEEEITDEWLMKLLDMYNGVPDDLMNYPEVISQALGTLRSDVVLFRNYSYGDRRRRLEIPIVAFGGERDDLVPAAEVERWHELGAAECATHIIPGGHFYYLDNTATVTAAMSKYLVSVHDGQKE